MSISLKKNERKKYGEFDAFVTDFRTFAMSIVGFSCLLLQHQDK